MKDEYQNIIMFDGVCNLCNGLVQFIIKNDSREKFKFASLQSSVASSLIDELSLDNNLETLVYVRNGIGLVRSRAALAILVDLGGLWTCGYLFYCVPRFISDFVYRLIAKSRYRVFGKKEVCMIPTPETEHRFLVDETIVDLRLGLDVKS